MDLAERVQLSLFGAPGSNTNLGLNALMQGTVAAALRIHPGARFTVFDNELGVRAGHLDLDGERVDFDLVGARLSRRVTRPESFAAMTASLAMGGLGNAGARAVLRSAAVLDVSGGDSFSDIYGTRRFRTVCAPKRLALRARRPLILLPQTYGPFTDRASSETARRLVASAQQAWARDADSFDVLVSLLGADFDPERHRLGVDLAMMLPVARESGVTAEVRQVMSRRPVGVNVSGLLWNGGEAFGLRSDYRTSITRIVEAIVTAGEEVVLVPHVLGRRQGGEADNLAGEELRATLPEALQRKVTAVEWVHDAARAKAVVAGCRYFVGTRMHSAIAALSTGTPCCAIAYSPKYRGVFGSMGVADWSLDARELDTADLVAAVLAGLEQSDAVASILADRLPAVRAAAQMQMADILALDLSSVP